MEMRYFAKGLSKIFGKSKFVFWFFNPISKVPGTDYFWFLNSKWFFKFFHKLKSVIYAIHFMISWLFHFQLPNFLPKFEYCKNQKSSLDDTKDIFYNFLRVSFWRSKNNRRHKLWIWTKMESNPIICSWVGVFKIWLIVASFWSFVAYTLLEFQMKLQFIRVHS